MKLKVLHINTFDSYGGASQVAYELVHIINAECTLLVNKKDSESNSVIQFKENLLDRFFLTIDKIIWKLGFRSPIKNVLNISDELNFTYSKLRKNKKYLEADIIHIHNIHGNYFDLSALRKIASEKFIVWTLHDMWAMTGGEAHTFENGNFKKGIGRIPYKNIYPLQNPIFDRRQHFLDLKKEIYSAIAPKLTFVPVSNWLEKCLTDAFVFNKNVRVQLNYNGINTAIFQNNKRRNWDKPRLLFFNIESPFKGSRLFLNILSRIKEEYELIVVGEPLKLNVTYNHIKYIDKREHLNALYNDVDLLIFPSLAESFGLVVLEALACGVCVIASNTGGIPEVLDNTSGYLFKSGDEEDMLNKINYALNNFSESRHKADVASGKVEKFSLQKSSDRYLALYEQILSYSNWTFRSEDIRQMSSPISINDFV